MFWKELLVINTAGTILAISGLLDDESLSFKIRRQRYGEGVPVLGNDQEFDGTQNIYSSKRVWMLEQQLKQLKDEIKDLNTKLNFLHLFDSTKDTENGFVSGYTKSKILKWSKPYKTKSTDQVFQESSEKYLRNTVLSFLEEKIGKIRGDIVTEIYEKLKKDFQTNRKRRKRNTDTEETDGYQHMNSADYFDTGYTYDNDFHQVGESALDKQLNKLTKIIEAELYQHKTNINADDSAVNNELPENIKSIVQSDGGFGLSIEKIFDMLRGEVRNSLQQQSKNVKITLNKHLDSVETKMAQILTLMEGMKLTYDKKFDNLLPTAISNGNKRIEQIETDIVTLESSMTSIRDNVISDPNIQDRLQQIQDNLQEEIAKEVQPIRRNIHELRERVQTNMRQQGVTETSLQNFKADMREKTHFLELDVTKLEEDVKDINKTVKTNQKKSQSYEIEKEKIMETVAFVDEIKFDWPFIWTNITNVVEMSKASLHDAKLSINNIIADIDKLNQNHTEVRNNIQEFKTSLEELSIRINKMKQVNIKLALEYDEWVEYNFRHTLGHSACLGGKKYIKKTGYNVGKYVGVMLCSRTRYKIYLSDNIGEEFLDIGDARNFGEDHCEFVGGIQSSHVTIGTSINWFRRMEGYKRANWGDPPVKGVLSFFTPSPPWYECGVSIP